LVQLLKSIQEVRNEKKGIKTDELLYSLFFSFNNTVSCVLFYCGTKFSEPTGMNEAKLLKQDYPRTLDNSSTIFFAAFEAAPGPPNDFLICAYSFSIFWW